VADSPNSDWMNQWQAMSRQYLSAWQEAARNGANAQAPSAAPMWPQGLDQAARLFTAGGSQGETIERLVDSAKAYATFMQSMLATSMQGGAAPNWSDALRQGFASMGGNAPAFGSAPMFGQAPMFGSTPMFGQPSMQAWQDLAGKGGDGFSQMMNAITAMKMPSTDGVGELKGWLNLPAFGLAREHQEHQQKSAIAWVEYQEHMARYNALMLKASQRGFELFEGKLLEREQPGRQIESLRALYDLWVDAAEEGYAEIALSQEFREAYGAMVNAQMRVRSQVQQEVERIATDFGMPTRSEINSIGERLQALRREVRELGAGDALAGEIAALREEFAAFKAGAKRTQAAPVQDAAAKPAAPRSAPVKAAPPVAVARKAAPRSATTRKPVAHAGGKRVDDKQASRGKAAPARAKARAGGKKVRRAEKAVAATASGNFASRIEKFASASLGTPRGKLKQAEPPVASEKSGKKKKSKR
jgi:class III poly(R)-hydroxyalkanoic acid synthase PhaE subunit